MSIVYKSNLNFIRIGKYLDILITAGMVEATTENESRLYSITERGREFLHTYERLRQALRTPALPAPGNILFA
jgi:predicted transcriptional regulator